MAGGQTNTARGEGGTIGGGQSNDEAGKIMTVRYDAVNAMLLNEFLKEHRKVEDQNTKIQNLEQSVDALKKMVQELAEKK